METAPITAADPQIHGIHVNFEVRPGSTESVVMKLPFVSDLSADEAGDLSRLQFESERNRTGCNTTCERWWKTLTIVGDYRVI